MDDTQILNTISNDQLLVVYYSYPGCNVCKVLRPKVENLLQAYSNATFLYVDIEQHPLIKGQQMVFTVPTVVVYNEGKELQRWSRHFSVDDLHRLIDRYNGMLAGE